MSASSNAPAVPADVPLVARLGRAVLRGLGSLRLAVVVMGLLAGVSAWATLIESRYGAPAAQFGIYSTWWFAGLGWLLALNVICAALVRFPWQRRHLGFVITHLGILLLLGGCLLGRWYGVQGQVPVFEGRATHTAYKDQEAIELRVSEPRGSTDRPAPAADPVYIPLRAGPFNWRDAARRSVFPWRLATRSEGLIYDRDGIRMEVLDYLSDSRRIGVPRITLAVGSGDDGSNRAALTDLLTLQVTPAEGAHAGLLPAGMGGRASLGEGRRVLFWMTGKRAQTEAFLRALPEGELGPLGQVVLWASGKPFRFDVAELRKEPRQPLGTTGLEVELQELNPWMLGVQLAVSEGDEPRQRMFLFAYLPYANQYDSQHGVYGAYWFDPAAAAQGPESEGFSETALREAAGGRVEILQGHDQQLYYREVEDGRPRTAARWPAARRGAQLGGRIVAFADSARPQELMLREFVPAPRPAWQVEPLPFDKDKRRRTPRVELRLSVDGQSSRFWLASRHSEASDVLHQVQSPRGRVSVSLGLEPIDLGFQLYLRRFRQQLDPGSRQAAHYSSLVDFFTRTENDPSAEGGVSVQRAPSADEPADRLSEESPAGEPLRKNVLITLNAPVELKDPRSGRVYRFFQTSFNGPFRPGDPEYDELVGPRGARDELYLSQLSINADPGRGLKYAGSAMIVIGIGVVYGLRGRRRRKHTRQQGPGETR